MSLVRYLFVSLSVSPSFSFCICFNHSFFQLVLLSFPFYVFHFSFFLLSYLTLFHLLLDLYLPFFYSHILLYSIYYLTCVLISFFISVSWVFVPIFMFVCLFFCLFTSFIFSFYISLFRSAFTIFETRLRMANVEGTKEHFAGEETIPTMTFVLLLYNIVWNWWKYLLSWHSCSDLCS